VIREETEMKIRLIVKGTAEIAAESARKHGLEVEKVISESKPNDSTGLLAEGTPEQVSNWFVEDYDAPPPYALGSLLWYGYDRPVEVET
jgi:hypothetical protein